MTFMSSRVDGESVEKETRYLKKRFLTPNSEQFEDAERFEDWLRARHEFMVRKGWRDPAMSEFDRYDADPQTAHIALYDEKDTLTFGMRLTPITSAEEALSWDMTADSAIHTQIDREALKTVGPLWDLTRLVPGSKVSPAQSFDIIPRLCHEGMVYSQQQGDENPLWMFALAPTTHRWLESQGVPITVLGRGKIGSDMHDTILGLTQPAAIDQSGSDFALRSRAGAL